MTFLQLAAQRIFTHHQPADSDRPIDLRDVWVILPTRRAVTVFLDELARHADKPFLAPHTLAVDDFITQGAGVQLIDSVNLLFELYDVFRTIDPAVEFEQFVGWASVLLTDFDRIDQYLIEPDQLFENLSAIKRLEAWNLELPKGASPITETKTISQYFQLFENLKTAYHALRERLQAQGLAYRGMAYRQLAETVKTTIRDNAAYQRVWFVGFNALSAAEERIIQVLTKAGKAELIWDSDRYYIDDPMQEAGNFLRRYRDDPLLFSETNRADLNEANALLNVPKTIRVVGVPNASMQAKVAGKLHQDWLAADRQPADSPQPAGNPATPGQPLRTAIVLADETLLVPVLYALDEKVTDLNITMGLSLRHSLLFTLVDTLFEMQRTVHEFRTRDGRDLRIPKFHHRHIVKLLNHPFVKQYERIHNCQWPGGLSESGEVLPAEPLFQWMARNIVKDQRVYMTERELIELGQDDALVRVLFRRWRADSPIQAIQSFYDLIDLLREVYRTGQDAIEIEYLYLFHTLLRQLETTLQRQAAANLGVPVTVRSFRHFLYELIRQTSIPFTSEGDRSLQLMGMLETRALDFDRVIVLSVNEGVLPQARKLNSLIPFDIASKLGMPTYREQEAVMAYHFYRLLQRASDVVLIHTTSPDAYGSSKGEASRFVRQIEHELVPKARNTITLSWPQVRFGRERDLLADDPAEPTVPKTPALIDELRSMLSTRGLYPSQLNQFISCSMRFYFSRLVRIAEDDDIEERMGAAEFGDWLHKVLERLDLEYRLQNKTFEEADVRRLLDEEFSNSMKGRVVESGMNLLLYDLAKQLMLDFQRQQSQLTDLTVLGTEQTLSTRLDVSMIKGQPDLQVRIAGKIDRIERYGHRIRIVDYKTGAVDVKKKTGDLPTLLKENGQEDKIRQLWLYRYLALKTIAEKGGLPLDKGGRTIYPAAGMPVEAGFYSFRDVNGGFKSNPVNFSAEDNPADYITQSEELLRDMVRAMLDPDVPFQRTTQLSTCEYCDFRAICDR
ncbi:PD-(D/E)XK nuclease family protein [Spirosoma luteolum]